MILQNMTDQEAEKLAKDVILEIQVLLDDDLTPEDSTRFNLATKVLELLERQRLIPKKVEYTHDEKGTIILPPGPPFDGEPVLIHFAAGWCEAWWDKGSSSETMEGIEYDGFMWVCVDDTFTMELDDALEWLPLPPPPETEKGG